MELRRNGKPWPLEPMDNIDISADFDSPAINRCCQAWYKAFKNAQAKGTNPVSVRLRANEAYRYAMPPLTSAENIRDFVACVVHGMMVGAVIDELGTRWLYAAQIAASMFKQVKRPKSMKKQASGSRSGKKSVPPSPSPADCLAVPADLTQVSAMACDEEQTADRQRISKTKTCEDPGAVPPPDTASADFNRQRSRKPLRLAVLHGVAEVNHQTNRQPRNIKTHVIHATAHQIVGAFDEFLRPKRQRRRIVTSKKRLPQEGCLRGWLKNSNPCVFYNRARLHRLRKNTIGACFVTGHDFQSCRKRRKINRALAPAMPDPREFAGCFRFFRSPSKRHPTGAASIL